MSDHSPERITHFESSEGYIGYLVIDRLVGGRAVGGLRIIPDPSIEETTAMARTMTLKHGFVGHPVGGAKAALQMPSEVSAASRERAVREFGAHCSESIRLGEWGPGLDMGCTPTDVRCLFDGAGVERPAAVRGSSRSSAVYTAWSVYFSTLVGLDRIGKPLSRCRFVVDGFGSVGSEYARILSDAGATLVGFSNRLGAAADEAGFDVSVLLELRAASGDEFIQPYLDDAGVDAEHVRSMDVDILVPAARAWSINDGNVEEVMAAVVPAAANVPMTPAVEERLNQRGKVVIPDFVANCGGVFGTGIHRYVSDRWIYSQLATRYRRRVEDLLERSQGMGTTIWSLASQESLAKLDALSAAPASPSRLQEFAKPILRRVPHFMSDPAMRWLVAKRFFS